MGKTTSEMKSFNKFWGVQGAVETHIAVLGVKTQRSLAYEYQCFGDKYSFHFQGRETYSLYLHKEDSPETGGNIFFRNICIYTLLKTGTRTCKWKIFFWQTGNFRRRDTATGLASEPTVLNVHARNTGLCDVRSILHEMWNISTKDLVFT